MPGFKTYLVALIPIVLGVLEQADITKVYNDPKAALTSIALGIVMAVMRYITEKTTVQAALHSPPPEPGEQ